MLFICVLQDVMSTLLPEDDAVSETSVADLSRFIPKMPPSPSISHIISIGQLMESVNCLPGLNTKLMLREILANNSYHILTQWAHFSGTWGGWSSGRINHLDITSSIQHIDWPLRSTGLWHKAEAIQLVGPWKSVRKSFWQTFPSTSCKRKLSAQEGQHQFPKAILNTNYSFFWRHHLCYADYEWGWTCSRRHDGTEAMAGNEAASCKPFRQLPEGSWMLKERRHHPYLESVSVCKLLGSDVEVVLL